MIERVRLLQHPDPEQMTELLVQYQSGNEMFHAIGTGIEIMEELLVSEVDLVLQRDERVESRGPQVPSISIDMCQVVEVIDIRAP